LTAGLYVGRFQPFHLGHLEAVKHILHKIDELVIVVGSAQDSHTLENPFTAGERITMIRLALRAAKIDANRFTVLPLPDPDFHKVMFDRTSYTATEVRKRILRGGNWEELLPRSVADYVKQIKGDERMREISQTDKAD